MSCHLDHEQLELMVNIRPDGGGFVVTRQHIKQCVDCRKKLCRIKELDTLIRRDMNAVPIPPYLVNQIMNRINNATGKKTL